MLNIHNVKSMKYPINSCVGACDLQLYQTHQKTLNGETSLPARSSCHGSLPNGMVELQLKVILLTNVNVALTSGSHVEIQCLSLSEWSFQISFFVNWIVVHTCKSETKLTLQTGLKWLVSLKDSGMLIVWGLWTNWVQVGLARRQMRSWPLILKVLY